jgi:FkbM family methyltransferase
MQLPKYLHDGDELISNIIRHTGDFYERPMLDEIAQYIEGKVVVDLGANIGNHTVYFAQLAKDVIAIEPHPANFAVLQKNADEYSNIILHNVACTSSLCRMGIETQLGNMGHIHVSRNDGGEIVGMPLDSITAYADFVKLDIEEHELEALQGAKALLEKCRPVLWIEIQTMPMLLAIANFLKPYGYEVVRVQTHDNPMFIFAVK